MTRTLLSFLGRAPKDQNGYRKTAYDFGDGKQSEIAAFFGWPLGRRIGAKRVVIMGTAGSMWDHLFEGDIVRGESSQNALLALMEAAETKAVTAALLDPLQQPLSEKLDCEVRLELIPYCRDTREQVELLGIMARHVGYGDEVHLDVSHGFRHLPMIGLTAALYLRTAREVEIGGIWYGAYDPDTGAAPVHDLAGLLRITDWIQAIHTYDKDGDYGAFAPLLGRSGDLLARAAFFERTSSPDKARKDLAGWVTRPGRFPADDPASELFRGELERRVQWHRQSERAGQERELAERYLDRRDYLRGAIYALESMVSAEVIRSGGNAHYPADRSLAHDELRKTSPPGFAVLNALRNAMAHDGPSRDPRIEDALADEAKLRRRFESLWPQLFGVPLQWRG